MLLSFLLRRQILPWLTLVLVLSGVMVHVCPWPLSRDTATANDEMTTARAILPTTLRGGHELPAPADSVAMTAAVPRWDLAERDLAALAAAQPYPVAMYIKDLRSGRVISYRDRVTMPSASLVKLPVMVAVYRAIAAGQLTRDTRIKMLERHKVSGCGPTAGVPNGQTQTVRELLENMITISDNTATNILVEQVGMDAVNRVCREHGLFQTDMIRDVMDLESRDRGVENLTSARDMGQYFEMLERGEFIGHDYCAEMRAILLRNKLRDRIPRFLPIELPIAHKTGLMYNVVHDVGTLYFPDRTVVVSVLTRDFPSYWVSKEFIGKVAQRVYQTMREFADTTRQAA
ncbi:MAG TPA: class A beta-lactamase-related serine hydrolase [bacterium]|nr:class A beta-lactamase-related serine hydrolase [bacterium]